MDLFTVENLQERNYKLLGVVTGCTIQTKNLFSDFGQGLKNMVGGELKAYTRMMDKARTDAVQRMVGQAKDMGADAIIGMRFSTSAIMTQAAEVLVYGTAIKYM
jgi:uncharacterized protein YbjQ (UPF0145 family)